mmetsp:Transcript_3349/g.11367  ORF Transcript_3349/g.11367 Transcript_3349/m.11367 type:complete len:210 (-) Transcript_3349:2500-3129(-)
MAHTHASRTKEAKSAPENPSSFLNSLTSLINLFAVSGSVLFEAFEAKIGIFRINALKISSRALLSGKGTYKSLSNLPGRNIAGSIISGLFVAAITNVAFLDSIPSISVSSWFTTLIAASPPPSPPPPLLGAKESSSSKKSTQGAAALARANKDRTARSDSPTYLFKSSGPLMDIKFAFASFATACATSVLPQPGGPYSKHPVDIFWPKY